MSVISEFKKFAMQGSVIDLAVGFVVGAAFKEIVSSLGSGAKAGSLEDAVKADIVLLALPWLKVPSLTGLTDWKNRVVIDATNHYISFGPEMKVADLGGRSSSEIVAEKLPGAKVVKAFNTLYFKILAANPSKV